MLDDLDQAAKFRAGDTEAFVALYHRHKKNIYAFCLRLLGNKEAAMDGVQEVFLRAFEKHQQLRDPARFKTWLFSIAHHYCLTRLRHKMPLWEEVKGRYAEPVAEQSDTSHEETQVLQIALGRLKNDYREIVVLREYQHLSYEEIAEVTGSTISAIKSKLFKARRQLCVAVRRLYDEEKS
jgi:RNA polymerase sigma-70 factor, ECF subfamily